MSEQRGGGGPSFEERLRAARGRQGLDSPPQAAPPSGSSPWGVGLRAGAEMVSALAVAVAIGLLLDRWLHTRPWMLMLFVLLGGAAGVLNVVRVYAPPKVRAPTRR